MTLFLFLFLYNVNRCAIMNEVVNMNIQERAKIFAIKAHQGQVRKSDKEKPMIIHPINVADILREYGYDDNVVAAGYLHDVVEDTKYQEEDILKEFGEDITSLVMGASEKDKSLSWEERKEAVIKEIKDLDLRHKAIICADKISNLEDFNIISMIKGEYDFSSFRRGYDKQKWYYQEVYKKLIVNEDANLPMFKRLKSLIDYVFNDLRGDEYLKDVIFVNDEEEYAELLKLHYRKEEIYKLCKILPKKPYIIEFTGTPRTGKTTLINIYKDFFKKKGFKVKVLEEFATSKKYKEELYPKLKDRDLKTLNEEIFKNVLKQLEEVLKEEVDIVIMDRGLTDRLVWFDRFFEQEGLESLEKEKHMATYLSQALENSQKVDLVIATYTDTLTALKRDYKTYLSLEERSFLNEQNLNEYNNSLLNIKNILLAKKMNYYLVDTTSKSLRELSILIAQIILENMRKEFIDRVNKEFNNVE